MDRWPSLRCRRHRVVVGGRFIGEPRIAIAPPPVHPQPECRIAPDVHLEHVGAALRELADGIWRVLTWRRHWTFVDEAVAPARKRQREHWNHWRAGTERERRECRRGGGRPIEEVDIHGVRRMQM